MNPTPPYGNIKILLDLFQANPNRTFSSEEILQKTGIARGSLTGGIQVIAKSHPDQMVKLGRGLYRWKDNNSHARKAEPAQAALLPPPPQPAPPPPSPSLNGDVHLYEVLGSTPAGDKIVCLEDGEICCLVPLRSAR